VGVCCGYKLCHPC
uniref:Chi-conotoxin MrIB n=1 Tax=Conus marmoreus TaxID=42752 RepID=CTA1B_CONMR|nr:RecName: Full=Chi-conotoxin MrIB; AltName: Full=Conotoxin MrIB; AltName: Full=Lambda/chi-conotoxin MrIB; Short=Chi-MrIB [Conus marmoreus]